MKQVILYGHLAKKFGRHHRLEVRTPAEAIRALQANFPDFRAHVLAHNEPGYHVRVGKEYRDQDGLLYPVDDVVKIIPAVSGRDGAGMILLGAALFIAAPYAAGFIMANTSMVGLAVGVATLAPSIGVALMLGGVSQMLFQPPKAQSVERPESKPSTAFNGPINTTTQGNAVPICYGRLMVGSQVISAGISAVDVPV